MIPPEPIAPEDAAALEALALRMGPEACARRIAREQKLHHRRGRCQHRGLFHLEACLDLYAFIRVCLQCCGLWKRAVRNYLDIRVENNEVLLDRLPAAFWRCLGTAHRAT